MVFPRVHALVSVWWVQDTALVSNYKDAPLPARSCCAERPRPSVICFIVFHFAIVGRVRLQYVDHYPKVKL